MLLIILIITEILTLVVIRQHFYDKSWMRYYFLITLNAILSIWLWILWFKATIYNGIHDQPDHLWVMMNLRGMLAAVVAPRIILILFHFWGVFVRRHSGGHNRRITNLGLVISTIFFLLITEGILIGRYRFTTDHIEVKINGLGKDLDGLRIVQISDLHLVSFYHHPKMLDELITDINKINPDIIVNTGDFINVGWREFGRFDTILSRSKAKYGKFAVLGNHDMGTYHPHFTEAEKENNILHMKNLISASGYKVLADEFQILNIGESTVAFIGVTTKGSFTHIIHSDPKKIIDDMPETDLSVLLAHDPNQWEKDVTGKTDIDITLSGHTHGMQIGILTRKFRWSPAKFFYPHWNGLYKKGEQYLIVNRGLGVMGIPFRIGMPPEITVITLKAE